MLLKEDKGGPGTFPFYIYKNKNYELKVFKVSMSDGEVYRAYVDASRQYKAEGLQWRNVKTREYIPKHHVKSWEAEDTKKEGGKS